MSLPSLRWTGAGEVGRTSSDGDGSDGERASLPLGPAGPSPLQPVRPWSEPQLESALDLVSASGLP